MLNLPKLELKRFLVAVACASGILFLMNIPMYQKCALAVPVGMLLGLWIFTGRRA